MNYTSDSPAIPKRNGAAVLWKRWRLLENRMLFDIESDPHQDHDVTADHPDVVSRMRAHLDQWWDGVKDDVMAPQRVIIGSDKENPMLLTACEWLDVFVDQQRQVRDAALKNGTWHLQVAKTGTYRIELRRWPRESGLQLTDGLPETRVTDGVFVPGKSLPITSATLLAGDTKLELKPQPNNDSFVTEVNLAEGPIEMSTSFFDPDGNEICGAYYAYIARRR